MKYKIQSLLTGFILSVGLSANADITIHLQGATPNMAACMPGYGEKYAIIASYAAYFNLAPNDARSYELKAYDLTDKEVATENVQFNIPALFADRNRVNLSQMADTGAFSFQVALKDLVACKNFKMDLTQVKIKAVPIN